MIKGTVRFDPRRNGRGRGARHGGWALVVGAAAAMGVFAGGCERKTRDTDIKIIALAEMKALLDAEEKGERGQIVLVDPRPRAAFEAAHIPGARNVQLPQIDPKGSPHPQLARFGTIVVYGEDPGSAVARGMTKRLLAVGHRGVRLYAGGVREWRSRGYPVASVRSEAEQEEASEGEGEGPR